MPAGSALLVSVDPVPDDVRDWITGEGGKGVIDSQQIGAARSHIAEGLRILIGAIDRLAQDGY